MRRLGWAIVLGALLVWMADSASAVTIDEFPASANGPSTVYSIIDLVVGPDGLLYFSHRSPDFVGRFAPADPPAIDPLVSPTWTFSGPYRLGIGGGMVWFQTGGSAGSMGTMSLATPNTFKEFFVPQGLFAPDRFVLAPDGNLWCVNLRSFVSAFPPVLPLVVSTTVNITSPVASDITVGPDKNIWFAGTSGIGRIDLPSHALTEFALPMVNPEGIASGPDGKVWFTETNTNQIGRIPTNATSTASMEHFSLPNPNSRPVHIVAGPDGLMWFTEQQANRIGWMDPKDPNNNGDFALPTDAAAPDVIVVGPDGSLWFTEVTADQIGRVSGLLDFTQPFRAFVPNNYHDYWKLYAAPAATAAVGTLVYLPAKMGLAIGGGVTSALVFAASLGDAQTTASVWRATTGGDWIVTPAMVRRHDSPRFLGSARHVASRSKRRIPN
jgi:virginiamycin B lyase